MRTCKICGVSIEHRGSLFKYCEIHRCQDNPARIEKARARRLAYYYAHKVPKPTGRTCKWCGKSIDHKHTQAVYCDKKCYRQTPEYRKQQSIANAIYRKSPSVQDRIRELNRSQKRMEYDRLRGKLPERRARARAYFLDHHNTPEYKADSLLRKHRNKFNKFLGWVYSSGLERSRMEG